MSDSTKSIYQARKKSTGGFAAARLRAVNLDTSQSGGDQEPDAPETPPDIKALKEPLEVAIQALQGLVEAIDSLTPAN